MTVMGRVTVVLLICMSVIIIVRHYQQSDSTSGSSTSEKVIQSHRGKLNTAQNYISRQRLITSTEKNRPPRRVLLEWRKDLQTQLQETQTKEPMLENPAVDDDAPFHLKLSIPTEADNDAEDVNHTVTRNQLFIELSTNSSCSSSVNWLCYNETEKGPCFNQKNCNSSNTLIMGGLQPDTLYILKANNDSVNECDLSMLNCSARLPKMLKYSTEALGLGIEPGPLDVMWSPSQKKCKREMVYIYRLKVNDPGNPEWRDIHRMRTLLPCRSLMCVNATNEGDENNGYTVQMRMLGAEDGFEAVRMGPESEMSLCARMALARRAARAKMNTTAANAANDQRFGSAWMNGLWAALGAAGGLALVTLLGICYFDKRSRAAREQKDESPEESAYHNLQVASGAGEGGVPVRHIPIVL